MDSNGSGEHLLGVRLEAGAGISDNPDFLNGPMQIEPPTTRGDLLRIIRERRLTPCFQPIVDLKTADIYAYEVLTRRLAAPELTHDLFARADAWGLSWELESTCQAIALTEIASLPHEIREKRFFLNVSPRVFADPRFRPGKFLPSPRQFGFEKGQIVFEITETNQVSDHARFAAIIRSYADQGYQIALDDFGSGHSSLVMLVLAMPHCLKLDAQLVRNIHVDPYRQHLLRSVIQFAAGVQTKVVAEGIERPEEVEVLLRLGIHYGQGYLFARPATTPGPIAREMIAKLNELNWRLAYSNVTPDNPVTRMVLRPPTVEEEHGTGRTLEDLFRATPLADHVILVRDGKPSGIVTRAHFQACSGGPFGYQLVQRKSAGELAQRNMLIVQEGVEITALGRQAMDRPPEALYDPVVITDRTGRFVGTVTMKELINTAVRTEIQIAANANPLTGLPGNLMIQQWIQEALDGENYTVLYADLDHFKEYNDSYGFSQGDSMIRLTARVLSENLRLLAPEANLGHLGGDDFLIVSRTVLPIDLVLSICRDFDEQKRALFTEQDFARGFYPAINRQGIQVNVPLVTMSVAVVPGTVDGPQRHPRDLGEIAARLKRRIKARNDQTRASGFLLAHEDQPAAPVAVMPAQWGE